MDTSAKKPKGAVSKVTKTVTTTRTSTTITRTTGKAMKSTKTETTTTKKTRTVKKKSHPQDCRRWVIPDCPEDYNLIAYKRCTRCPNTFLTPYIIHSREGECGDYVCDKCNMDVSPVYLCIKCRHGRQADEDEDEDPEVPDIV